VASLVELVLHRNCYLELLEQVVVAWISESVVLDENRTPHWAGFLEQVLLELLVLGVSKVCPILALGQV
jgi:hypothetical protein